MAKDTNPSISFVTTKWSNDAINGITPVTSDLTIAVKHVDGVSGLSGVTVNFRIRDSAGAWTIAYNDTSLGTPSSGILYLNNGFWIDEFAEYNGQVNDYEWQPIFHYDDGTNYTSTNVFYAGRTPSIVGSGETLTLTTIDIEANTDLFDEDINEVVSGGFWVYRDYNGVGFNFLDSVDWNGLTATTYTDTTVDRSKNVRYFVENGGFGGGQQMTTYTPNFIAYSQSSSHEYPEMDYILKLFNAPSGLTSSNVGGNSFTLDWDDNNTFYAPAPPYPDIIYGVQLNIDGLGWSTYTYLSGGVETYNFTGLTGAVWDARVVAQYQSAPSGTPVYYSYSEIEEVEAVLIPTAPSGVTATTIGYFEADIEWVDNSDNEDGFYLQQNIGGNWIIIADLPSGSTGYTMSGLDPETTYIIRVAAYNDNGQSASESYTFSTLDLPDAWCSLESGYTVSKVDCGILGVQGYLQILDWDVYSQFYDFSIGQIRKDGSPSSQDGQWTINWFSPAVSFNASGTSFQLSTGFYYALRATPKTSYLRDSCEKLWIPIEAEATILELTASTLTNAICGSFNQQEGRAVLSFSGMSVGSGGYVKLFGEQTGSYYYEIATLTNQVVVFENLKGDTYRWVVVAAQDGALTCTLNGLFVIEEEKIYSVPNVKEIYVTEWYDNFDVNYWSTASDPDYYAAEDTLKFQSTKVASYTTGLTWYYIPVDEQNVSFNQNLQKVRQGFIFSDTLSIAFSVYDYNQWQTLKNVLANKYVVVFKDNNDQWWTFGYAHGADTTAYSFGSVDGGFKFTFSAVSENKILTAINEDFVTNYIKN